MAPRARKAFVWTASVAGACLVASAATVGVLAATGAVDSERWAGALAVLRGRSEAVAAGDIRRLREAAERLEEREGLPGEAELVASWARYRKERERLAARCEDEREALVEIERRAREDLRRAEEIRRETAERDRPAPSSERVWRIYRHMRPAEVARDVERMLAEGREREAAAIVRAMTDRRAGEVLGAMGDPAARMRMLEALAASPGPEAGPDEAGGDR